MPRYRNSLPQLSGDIFLADAGVETDLIFNHGIEIREFAAHHAIAHADRSCAQRPKRDGVRSSHSLYKSAFTASGNRQREDVCQRVMARRNSSRAVSLDSAAE